MEDHSQASGCANTSSKRRRPFEDNNGCHRTPKRSCSESEHRLPFACPLYAAYPGRFTPESLCASRGWMEIPRLKEHIYRCHYQISCDRCLEIFKQDKDLVAHRRQTKPCQRKDSSSRDPVTQGIGQDTMSMLKSRKRSSSQDAEQKWWEIWNILFPQAERPEDPYNHNANLRSMSITSPVSESESSGNWSGPLAKHIAISIFGFLPTTGSQPNEDMLLLLKTHIAQALKTYPGPSPAVNGPDDIKERPKIEDTADRPEQVPPGASGSASNVIPTESSSNESSWSLPSTGDPSLLDYSWDPGYGMSSLPVSFMPINWDTCHSGPGWDQSFPVEGPRILPTEELPLPPLATLSLGSDALPASDGSPDPCDWYNIGQFHEMACMNDGFTNFSTAHGSG